MLRSLPSRCHVPHLVHLGQGPTGQRRTFAPAGLLSQARFSPKLRQTPSQRRWTRRFIRHFKIFEQFLKDFLRSDSTSYAFLLEKAKEKGIVPEQDYHFLLNIAGTRHLWAHMVHPEGNYPLVPDKGTVLAFERMSKGIMQEKPIGELFAKPVKVWSKEESIFKVMEHMQQHRFSHEIIRRADGTPDVVTSRQFTYFFYEYEKLESKPALRDVKVKDVLQQYDRKRLFLLPPESTLATARKIFEQKDQDTRASMWWAILITEKGRKTGKPLGLITRFDISGGVVPDHLKFQEPEVPPASV